MGVKLVIFFIAAIGAVLAYFFSGYGLTGNGKYEFPHDGYFGPGDKKNDSVKILPFKIDIKDTAIQDLKLRLKSSRIGHHQLEDVPDFSYGFNQKYLLKIKDYWLKSYDWRAAEAKLNSFPQFLTEIEGLKIHFLDVPPPSGKYPNVVPLLLVHGWPGNVYEFHKIIDMLTDPAKHSLGFSLAFHVIAPSIPGYGFSEQPHKKGFNHIAAARVFRKLMKNRLKFNHYVAQGGDWGSIIVSTLAKMFPEDLLGVHLNMFPSSTRDPIAIAKNLVYSIWPSLFFKDSRFSTWNYIEYYKFFLRESGYMHIQATKPDTVGVGLNDSPIGLAAYILEKFSTWTHPEYVWHPDGGLTKKYTLDELLTIVSIYWFEGNIVSSQRFYKEIISGGPQAIDKKYISVPTGYAAFMRDLIVPPPFELIRKTANFTHVTYIDEGGHFAALEEPTILAKHVLDFVSGLDFIAHPNHDHDTA
uniref:Epoxide hydrolase n=1 Tax=Panagrellus redivivus TaxID=6233 RepID=A0A7E4VPK6_PANRE